MDRAHLGLHGPHVQNDRLSWSCNWVPCDHLHGAARLDTAPCTWSQGAHLQDQLRNFIMQEKCSCSSSQVQYGRHEGLALARTSSAQMCWSQTVAPVRGCASLVIGHKGLGLTGGSKGHVCRCGSCM